MDEEAFICFGVLALCCLVVALPLSIVALVIAIRASRRVSELGRRFMERPRERPPEEQAWEPRPAEPVLAPPVVVRPTPTPPAPPARPVGAGLPPPAPPPVQPVRPVTPPAARKPFRWEELIGLKVLAMAGGVVILIGAGLFVAYAHERGWLGRLGPHVRVALMVLAGLGFLAAGEACARRGFRALARVLTGGGLAFEYFATYSAWARFHLVPEPAAWGLMTVVTAVAILLSVRYASLVVAILSLVGGLAAPILIRPERDPGHVLFLYLTAVNAGVLVLAYFKKWRVLNLLALAGTIVNVVVWLYAHYWHGGVATEKLALVVTYMSVLWAIYFALSVVYHLLGRRDPSHLDLPVTLLNAVAYFTGLYVLLRDEHHPWLGPAAVLLGAVYLAEGLAVRRWAPGQARFVLLQVGQALGLLTLAIPIQLSGVFIPMAWAAEGTVLFWLGMRLKDWRVRAAGLLVHAASIVALAYYAEEAWNTKGMLVLNARTATFAAVALAMALSAWLYRRLADRKMIERVAVAGAAVLAHAVLMVLIGVEVCRWYEDASVALEKVAPRDLGQRLEDLAWARDAILAAALAVYGLAAVGLAAALRRVLHHAMALAAFAACGVVLVLSLDHLPELAFVAGWNTVGATFAGVAACAALAAVVSRYAGREVPCARGLAITYELLALGTVLGLYVTEVGRAVDHMVDVLGVDFGEDSVSSLMAAGCAVMGGLLVARGTWIRSVAHRVGGLLALAVALVILGRVTVAGSEAYATPFWQPRGVAFLLLVGALAVAVVAYGRQLAERSPERRLAAPILAVLAHAAVLVCFTVEAEDFWATRADQWFRGLELHAWYARHATLSVGYALYAFALLSAGIRRRSVMLRVLALVILGGTLVKVMVLDLSRLEAIWRILSLGGLGLLLLAASLLYHKYRHVIFRTETPEADKKEGGRETM